MPTISSVLGSFARAGSSGALSVTPTLGNVKTCLDNNFDLVGVAVAFPFTLPPPSPQVVKISRRKLKDIKCASQRLVCTIYLLVVDGLVCRRERSRLHTSPSTTSYPNAVIDRRSTNRRSRGRCR